jgi:nitric oxide reductase large subunit
MEKYIRVSFWGLNVGLAMMVVSNLFPGGLFSFMTCCKTDTGTRVAQHSGTAP